ncbi:hypothetical protein A3Q56_03886 [Intoshia linei]|uniref:Dynein heavy chain n=1 Tax=Intoshia linei TaxID=1819745 RepID=A0A177B462_9BILA|nr:hypothetical protein A3Q56_03886 [Intoshia linei]
MDFICKTIQYYNQMYNLKNTQLPPYILVDLNLIIEERDNFNIEYFSTYIKDVKEMYEINIEKITNKYKIFLTSSLKFSDVKFYVSKIINNFNIFEENYERIESDEKIMNTIFLNIFKFNKDNIFTEDYSEIIDESKIAKCKSDTFSLFEKEENSILKELFIVIDDSINLQTSTINDANNRLSIEITFIYQFIQHVEYIKEISADMSVYEQKSKIVNDLYKLIFKYNIHVNDLELALFKSVARTMRKLKNSLIYSEAKLEENAIKFGNILDNNFDQILSEIIELKAQILNKKLLNPDMNNLVAVYNEVKKLISKNNELKEKSEKYTSYNKTIKIIRNIGNKKTAYTINSNLQESEVIKNVHSLLSSVDKNIAFRELLWNSYFSWKTFSNKLYNDYLNELNVSDITKFVQNLSKKIEIMEQFLPKNCLLDNLKKNVNEFNKLLPCIIDLRNPNLNYSHWKDIGEMLTGRMMVSFNVKKNINIEEFIKMDVTTYAVELHRISSLASHEASLTNMLTVIVNLWKNTTLNIVTNTNMNLMLVQGLEDVLLPQLEESKITLSIILSSKYVKPIENSVSDWLYKIKLSIKTVEEWNVTQRNIINLSGIFKITDIQKQLKNESKKYLNCEKIWQEIMLNISDNQNVIHATTKINLYEILSNINSILEKTIKAFVLIIESKRNLFARFYFLSNSDIITMLSYSNNVENIQPFLLKCFTNINKLIVDKYTEKNQNYESIIQFVSVENEKFDLVRPIRIRGSVEQWMTYLESVMYDSVKKSIKSCLTSYSPDVAKEWILNNPSQAVVISNEIHFNTYIESLILNETKYNLNDGINVILNQIVKISNLINTLNTTISQKITLKSLLIVNVYFRDVINDLNSAKISSINDYKWLKRLRIYWKKEINDCVICQNDTKYCYGYEYIGPSNRLVITPLTDRAQLTISTAFNMYYGVATYGPTGTGKTETIKNMAKMIGKRCINFNCSNSINIETINKYLIGTITTGSWICLDEINRLGIRELSSSAQMIQSIKLAKIANYQRFNLNGKDVHLDKTSAIFVSLNTVNYCDKANLPDNLKSQFRFIAMIVPDYELILEVLLLSEGFGNAKILSKKTSQMFELAQQQFSQQYHYDFSLRSIALIVHIISLIKSKKKQNLSLQDESTIVIQAIIEANKSKLLKKDMDKLQYLIENIFGENSIVQYNKNSILEMAISINYNLYHLNESIIQKEKCLQYYNQLIINHGLILIGPSLSGKSTITNIVKNLQYTVELLKKMNGIFNINIYDYTYDSLPEEVMLKITQKLKKSNKLSYVLNPGSVDINELYGFFDGTTTEWHDGIIGNVIRLCIESENSSISSKSYICSNFGIENSRTTTPTSQNSSPKAYHIQSDKESNFACFNSTELLNNKFIIFDGPIYPEWMENLNTLLDASRILCLPNGERLNINNNLRLIFEVDDLSTASPADVNSFTWKEYLDFWIKYSLCDVLNTNKEYIMELFKVAFQPCLDFLRKYVDYTNYNEIYDIYHIKILCFIFKTTTKSLFADDSMEDKNVDRKMSSYLSFNDEIECNNVSK